MSRSATFDLLALALAASWLGVTAAAHGQQVIHVDARADDPVHNGSSWCRAFVRLDDALAVATAGDTIRIAQGTYVPDPAGLSSPRTATFQLQSGVVVEGGFAGCGAADPDERDPAVYETILSGDLHGDDEPGFVNVAENVYHVLTAEETDENTAVDGLVISGGNADGGIIYTSSGGAIDVSRGTTHVTAHNCTFRSNQAQRGGAVRRSGTSIFTNCLFTGNNALEGGGAIYENSGQGFTDCVFRGNTAPRGGAVYVLTASPRIVGCEFEGNSATIGGGLYVKGLHQVCSVAYLKLTDCNFVGNNASGGGAVYIDTYAEPTLTNCRFSGNTVIGDGAAIFSKTVCHWDVVHCTFTANVAGSTAGGIHSSHDTVHLRNTVLWGNQDENGMRESAQLHIIDAWGTRQTHYCCIQGYTGAYPGDGNIDTDPLLVGPAGADGVPGTSDDDLHLTAASPCIGAGDPDPEGLPETDFEGDVRGLHCRPDIGADEVALSPDCNGNGMPDACDILDGTSADCGGNNIPDECEPDCNANGLADSCDIAFGTSVDCNRNNVPDMCDLDSGLSEDCNENALPDECELEGIVTFEDRFPAFAIDPEQWPYVSGAHVYCQMEYSSPCCLRLIGRGTAMTRDIDASYAEGLQLTYYARNRYTDDGDSLVVRYWDGQFWTALTSHPGEIYLSNWQAFSLPLPPKAWHDALRISFNHFGDSDFEYWYVDDVEVVAYAPDCNDSGWPDTCEPLSDFDMDLDVDLKDIAIFQTCYTGFWPDEHDPVCCFFDVAHDLDIDMDDFVEIQEAMTGP